MRDMLKAGVHLGHHTRYWNPKMRPFIYAAHHKLHIIDLEKTLVHLEEACRVARKMAVRGETILFVGTKRTARKCTQEQALRCGMPYINVRWLGGMLTNYRTIRQSVGRLEYLEKQAEDGTFDKLTKKEALGRQRQIHKLHRAVGGIKDMHGPPNALFVLDVRHEKIAVTEASRLGIPIIGVVDTNSDPDRIDYVIPGNDDSFMSAELYTRTLANAIIEGRTERDSITAQNQDSAESTTDLKLDMGKVVS